MRTKIKLVFPSILILCSLCLGACSPSDKLPEVKHNPDPLWEVELEGANPEFVEDYIYLWDLLENEYPFLAAAERITGKDAQEIKEKYYNRIPLTKTHQDFYFVVVSPCLSEFSQSGHLSVVPSDLYEKLYITHKGDWDYTESHPHSLYNFSQLTTPEALSFYADAVEKAELRLAENPNTPITFQGNSGSDNLSFEYYPEQSAGYVNVSTMKYYPMQNIEDNPDNAALRDFFTQLESEGYENCIIDIMGNTGGSDPYWHFGLVRPNLAEPLYFEGLSLVKGDVCEYYSSALFGLTIDEIGNLDKSELSELNSGDIAGVGHYRISERELFPLFEKPLFTGKFWLLVDGYVYSSSESLTKFCKETGFATLVGTNTGGDSGGGDPIHFALPNTGICIRFSSEMSLNPDGSCNEEFGTAPDYPIVGSEDALEKCLEIIEAAN